jgi:hypothetical protein
MSHEERFFLPKRRTIASRRDLNASLIVPLMLLGNIIIATLAWFAVAFIMPN